MIEIVSEEIDSLTHPLYRVPSPKPFEVPLLIIRSTNDRCRMSTYDSPALFETPGGPTTQAPRGHVDIEEGIRVNVLDLVDSRPEL